MSPTGYSDRINHALAFAAKHHDQQVRRGTRPPYLTQPANVAIILTRYRCADGVVVAGILYDVVEDFVRSGASSEVLEERVGEKFGRDVLATLLMVVARRADDDGIEMSAEERRADVLLRLVEATDEARWAFTATMLHAAASLLADLRRTVDPSAVWQRTGGGREATLDWYRRAQRRLGDVGFSAPIVDELRTVVGALQRAGEP